MKREKIKLRVVVLILFCMLANHIVSFAQGNAEASYYEGTIDAGTQKILIWLAVQNLGPDSLVAFVDVPEQSVFDKPIDKVTIEDNVLWFQLKAFATTFSGDYKEDGQTIDGIWKQAGQEFPLLLKRLDKKPEVNRPQEPVEPFPYRSDEVFFENRSAKIKLAGTLTLPENSWNAPAVVLVSGSGAQNRNSELLGHKPFLVLSDYLTRNGIAVLRYDERGVGESEGKFSTATTFDLAEDVMAAVDFLKNHKGINPQNIGIIGHSEGGLIAPIVAAKMKELAFIVMLAGPGTSGEQILYQQSRLISLAEGSSEREVAKNIKFISKVYDVAKSDLAYKIGVEEIRKIYKKRTRFMSKKKREANNLSKANSEMVIQQVLSSWFRAFLRTDPATYLQHVKCPVLALFGSKDLQVPEDPNLKAIESILLKSGNNNVTTQVFADLNHLFQHCETGSPSEYFSIEETFSEDVMKFVSEWVHDHPQKK